MPTIRPSSDLRNNYNEISEFCHKHNEPVFITKNGKGDLAVMSMDAFDELEQLNEMNEIYAEVERRMANFDPADTIPAEEVFEEIRRKYNW